MLTLVSQPLELASTFAEGTEPTEYPPVIDAKAAEALRQTFTKSALPRLQKQDHYDVARVFSDWSRQLHVLHPNHSLENPERWYEPYLLSALPLLSCPYHRISAQSFIALLQVLLQCPFPDNLVPIVPWIHEVLQNNHTRCGLKPRVYLIMSSPYDRGDALGKDNVLTDEQVAIILECEVKELGGTNIPVLFKGGQRWLVPCWEFDGRSSIFWKDYLSKQSVLFILETLNKIDMFVQFNHNPRRNYDKVVRASAYIQSQRDEGNTQAVEIWRELQENIVPVIARKNEALSAWVPHHIEVLLCIVVWQVMEHSTLYNR